MSTTEFVTVGPGYMPSATDCFQWEAEFRPCLAEYKKKKPKKVLEIGTYHGGTLYHWLQNAPVGATVVSVDSYAVGIDNRHLYQDWVPEGVELVVIDGDSHSPDTAKQVSEHGPYNWVFIDAGHLYDEVRTDWELYGAMAAKKGIVAFHDILPPSAVWPTIEVETLWREIQRGGYWTKEIVADVNVNWGGIGLCQIP